MNMETESQKIPVVFWEEQVNESPVPVRIHVLDRVCWRMRFGRVLRAAWVLLAAWRLG